MKTPAISNKARKLAKEFNCFKRANLDLASTILVNPRDGKILGWLSDKELPGLSSYKGHDIKDLLILSTKEIRSQLNYRKAQILLDNFQATI